MNKMKKYGLSLCIVLLLMLSMGIITCQIKPGVERNMNISLKTRDAPFVINGDTALQSKASEGNGTAGNPFILENYVINASGTGLNGIYIRNTAAHFILRNCTITNTDTNRCGIDLENVTNGKVMNNTLTANDYGIYLNHTKYNILDANTVELTTNYAISLQYSNYTLIDRNRAKNGVVGIYQSEDSHYSIISNNIVDNHSIGICLLDYGHTVGNTILNNTARNNKWPPYGIGIALMVDGSNNTVKGNFIEDNYHGLFVQCNPLDSNPTEVINNTIKDNIKEGILVAANLNNLQGNVLLNNTVGIYLLNSNQNTLTQNTLWNNTSGINLTGSSSNTIDRNTLDGNGEGCALTAGSYLNVLAYNTILNSLTDGLYLDAACEGNRILYSILAFNRAFGIEVNGDDNYFYRNLVCENNDTEIWNQVSDTGSNYWVEDDLDGNGDLDTDGLPNAEELLWKTDPYWGDTDRDNLNDGFEVNYGTNPLQNDTDNDNISDFDEIYVHFTNPLDRDTDNDTLSDDVEIFSLFTNPSSPDTDGDGYSDGTEIAQGTSPLNPDDYPGKPAIDSNTLLILIFLGVLIGMMAALILVVWKTRKAKPEPLNLSLKNKST